ncbi:MAG TPA: hypothetical protein PLX33_10440 [Alphaproteobacteria bacterium]|nr:hypothetical protein [Alphaproteobacteria bacterium]
MTTTPELMPDEISLFRCPCEGDIKWSEDSSDSLATYVNEDLYTAACAERDALRELCEGMAKEIQELKFHSEIVCQDGEPEYPFLGVGLFEDLWQSLAAYEKHNGGE